MVKKEGMKVAIISSIGISVPKYELKQEEAKTFVRNIFPRDPREIDRLLPVFTHAAVEKRQFVVPIEWFKNDHSFTERNELYQEQAVFHSLQAIDQCLGNSEFLLESIPYEAIDMIIFISSTGISTPSIDAKLINERPFRDDVKRVPIWGLGCAGGASGFSRAYDFIKANPNKNVLVVAVELCSLTFQKDDSRKSNFIGTALFGDGIAAALVMGEESSYYNRRKKEIALPKITASSSKIKKQALEVMGWKVVDTGFQVIFEKSIPHLVETFWAEHIDTFLKLNNLTLEQLPFLVAHPGGMKVLQAYQEVLKASFDHFKYSYEILRDHGNMSSVTVFHVLKKWMEIHPANGVKSIMAALGPGFSSELVGLEWKKS